jgi:hypothetical protein
MIDVELEYELRIACCEEIYRFVCCEDKNIVIISLMGNL